jgi:hypothetical protein
MNDQLRNDIRGFPDVFWLKEPLDDFDIQRTCDLWNPPDDLTSFWREFGTGDMFESERILRPFAKSSSVEFITARERNKGLPKHLTAFHYGIFVSGFDSKGFEVFDPDSYRFLGRFDTLDQWYITLIRRSWWERYKLPKV